MMSDASVSWDLFGTFLAVMKHGSLSAASRELRVAQPTVRRQMEALEEALGVVLFTRATNGLVPTETALATLPYAEAMASQARALVRSVSGPQHEERGTVRVTASEIVGGEVLPPMMASLARSHPRIQIEVALSNRNEDLLRRDADIAVRMNKPTQAGLVTKRLADIQLGFFATPDYLAAHPPPRTLAGLQGHALVGSDRDRGLIEGLEQAGLTLTARDFVFRSDNHLAQLAAVRAGVGIGICQLGLSRALERVLPKVTLSLEAWLVMHQDLRALHRVRLVFDHLVLGLQAYAKGPLKGLRDVE